jgi:ATP-dependent Lon protease
VTDLGTETTLPLLPLTNGVVLPGMTLTIGLETPEARAAADAAQAGGDSLLLVPKVGGRYATVGTIAEVGDRRRLRGGLDALVVSGLARARVGTGVAGTGAALWVSAEPVVPEAAGERAHQLAREYRAVVESILDQRGASEMARGLREIEDPGTLADTAGWSPDLAFEAKVELLETLDVVARLERALGWMKNVLADLSLKDRIRRDVAEGMERSQREFLLRQQLNAIRKELGQSGEEEDLAESYRSRLESLALGEVSRRTVAAEIDKLERMSEQSPEHGWLRGWLDTVFEMPWSSRSPDNLDIDRARAVLDADHFGLEDVKERIVEFLAVRKLRNERRGESAEGVGGGGGQAGGTETLSGGIRRQGAILALVGPPGVGKTSLGESVARAMGRRFARVALGGNHDEAEIRGHRRTYVGAAPGRIVRALQEAGTMNPVLVLDEVDKVGADWRGDPAAALLEVLDPAQNHHFRDRYLEIDLDLSDVVFIVTANVVETIPPPLLDRLELISLDGYTEEEKVRIARDHLWNRQLQNQGLRPQEAEVDEEALRRVISDYTREAGVRSLERQLARLLRKVAAGVAAGTVAVPVHIDPEAVRRYLGRARFFFEAAERTAVPGVATGLAVTGAGGDILFVEATAMADTSGSGQLTVTGQLGDVMKESSQIALSYVRAHAEQLGLDSHTFDQRRFHLHVPAGAVPKDGPSAGVTMVTALTSLLTGRPVRESVGMTGELSLQGRVLPIGGVKQKVLAAHRAGLRQVVLPARNEGDLEDVPEAIRQDMTFHLAEDVTDVLEVALAPV